MKKAIFHPKALSVIRDFPEDVRHELGKLIFLLQLGQSIGMPVSRPMPEVASGVYELRVQGQDGSFRAFYYTRVRDSILVCHAFGKKTQKTPALEIELGRKRLKELLNG